MFEIGGQALFGALWHHCDAGDRHASTCPWLSHWYIDGYVIAQRRSVAPAPRPNKEPPHTRMATLPWRPSRNDQSVFSLAPNRSSRSALTVRGTVSPRKQCIEASRKGDKRCCPIATRRAPHAVTPERSITVQLTLGQSLAGILSTRRASGSAIAMQWPATPRNSSSYRLVTMPSAPSGAREAQSSQRLHRITEDLEARARRVFPDMPSEEMARFIARLARTRLQEEECKAGDATDAGWPPLSAG